MSASQSQPVFSPRPSRIGKLIHRDIARLRTVWSPVLIALILGGIAGCKPPAPSAGKAEQPATSPDTTGPASGITAASTPTEVAEAVLAAMKGDSMKAIEQLVARKKVEADVQAITGGRSQFAGMANNAVRLAAVSVASELNSLDSDSRRVSAESITGDRATCTISGTKNGQPAEATLNLVREDGTWKLVPSHR